MAPDELKKVVMLCYKKHRNAILHIPNYMIP